MEEYVPNFLRSEQHLADVSGSSKPGRCQLNATQNSMIIGLVSLVKNGEQLNSSPAPAIQPALRSAVQEES